MERLVIRQRWMALPWGGFTLAIALVLAGIGVFGHIHYPDDKPSVRVIVPMFGLYLYVVAALLCNWRTAVVTPSGLSVSVWPFIVRWPRRLRRDKIRHCYVRNVQTTDDGTSLESYYSAGVESLRGEQIEVSGPHWTVDEARQVAEGVARAFGGGVAVVEVEQMPRGAEVVETLVLMGVWLAVFIGAVWVGVEWEGNR